MDFLLFLYLYEYGTIRYCIVVRVFITTIYCMGTYSMYLLLAPKSSIGHLGLPIVDAAMRRAAL